MSGDARSGLDRYELHDPIGIGGFATVYRAEDSRFGDLVAVKILAENHSLNPEIRARFLSEAHLLRRIRSDHLIDVLDVGETRSGQPYMVLEYAGGGDLKDRAPATPPAFDALRPQLRGVATVLAGALAAIHAESVVHRDITPANLLIRRVSGHGSVAVPGLLEENEQLVLADLGHAKDLALHSGLTVAGGTAGFSAPEQRGGAAVVDARADIYAATAVLFWLVTGTPPGLGDDAGSEAARTLAERGVPPDVAEVVERGLHHDPAARHASIRGWRSDLLAALGEEPRAAGAPAPVRPRRFVARLAIAAAVVLAVAVLATIIVALADPVSVQSLEDGRVEYQVDVGDSTLHFVTPEEMTVGETGVVGVSVDGDLEWVLIGPDGSRYNDEDALTVRPTSPGTAEVAVMVLRPGDDPLVVRHTITAVAVGE